MVALLCGLCCEQCSSGFRSQRQCCYDCHELLHVEASECCAPAEIWVTPLKTSSGVRTFMVEPLPISLSALSPQAQTFPAVSSAKEKAPPARTSAMTTPFWNLIFTGTAELTVVPWPS